MSPESITMRVLPPEADNRETISISAAKVKENFGVLRRNEKGEPIRRVNVCCVLHTVARDHHQARKEESAAQQKAVREPTLP